MKITNTVNANNPAEATAYLQSVMLDLQGQKTGEVVYTGPYYPDMLQQWINHAYEQTANPKLLYSIVDASAVPTHPQARALEQRFLATYEDGSTGYTYSLS